MRAALFPLLLAGSIVAGAAHASTLRLALNHTVRLPTSGPASSVVLGSPTVVDVSVVDSRTVFVSGKTPGATDVTVIDPLGRVVYHGEIVVGGASTVRVFRGGAVVEQSCSPYCAAAEPGAVASPAAAPASSPLAALSAALGSAPAATPSNAAASVVAAGQSFSPTH